MDQGKPIADIIRTVEWYKHVRTWRPETHCDATASISPETAIARQESCWEIAVTLGNMQLEPGDHVAVEVNAAWTLDRGRPYVFGRLPFREEGHTGYDATPKVEFPGGVQSQVAVTPADGLDCYFIIDAVIVSGRVPAGAAFKVFVADPVGNLICCPWFAQDVPVPVAIRKRDDDTYRRLKEIPVLHVVGAPPKLWNIVATPRPDHKGARVQVTAADIENLNPSECANDPEILPCDGWDVSELERQDGYHGAPVWRGMASLAPRAAPRLEVLNRECGLYGRSHPIAPSLFKDAQVYFGDLHGQSNCSVGFGSEREYFWWARDAELLDFAAPANHYGGRETFSEDLWHETIKLCDEFNDPGRFATLFSYEWNQCGTGHRNVYYAENPGQLFCIHATGDARTTSVDELWTLLQEQGLPVLTVPHHLKFRPATGMNWREFHGEFQRLAEVCSIWGNSEKDGPKSLQAGLMMGHRIGVVGGTDTHFSQAGRPVEGVFGLGGIAAVICERLERKAIWDSLYARRCYATTGARILLDFRLNGQLMGSVLPECGARKITGRVIGTEQLESVEIICNNEVWESVPVSGKDTVSFEFEDVRAPEEIALTPRVPVTGKFIFYYLRVTQKDRHWAMSSPIWVVI